MTNVSRYGCHAITVDGEGPECVTPLPCLSSRPKFAASQVTLSPLRGSEHAVSVTSKTNTDLVVDALRASSRPLDDDQLAIRSGVRPRQTVNRICRDLERSGVLRRFLGPDLKTVNELLVTAANDDPLGGSSHEQRAAESTMLAELAQVIGLNLSPRRLVHSSGARVEIDGTDAHLRVLVECWAHQARPRWPKSTS